MDEVWRRIEEIHKNPFKVEFKSCEKRDKCTLCDSNIQKWLYWNYACQQYYPWFLIELKTFIFSTSVLLNDMNKDWYNTLFHELQDDLRIEQERLGILKKLHKKTLEVSLLLTKLQTKVDSYNDTYTAAIPIDVSEYAILNLNTEKTMKEVTMSEDLISNLSWNVNDFEFKHMIRYLENHTKNFNRIALQSSDKPTPVKDKNVNSYRLIDCIGMASFEIVASPACLKVDLNTIEFRLRTAHEFKLPFRDEPDWWRTDLLLSKLMNSKPFYLSDNVLGKLLSKLNPTRIIIIHNGCILSSIKMNLGNDLAYQVYTLFYQGVMKCLEEPFETLVMKMMDMGIIPNMKAICACCQRENDENKFIACKSCGKVYYCSYWCQNEHRSSHLKHCILPKFTLKKPSSLRDY